MEKNCLVTKYKATVNDNSLLKVGEMFIDIIEQESPTNQTNRLYLNTSDTALVVEVENGAANLTLDENMASGWTNKITLQKSEFVPPVPVFVRNGNYRVKVFSKYNLIEVGRWTIDLGQKSVYVDTKYLKYSPNIQNLYCRLKGKLENLKGCTKLNKMGWYNITYHDLTGNLSDLAPLTSLTSLYMLECPNIIGNLSDLAPLTSLTSLYMMEFPNIIGNLSELAPLTSLTFLGLLSLPNIKGNLSELAPLTSLTSLTLLSLPNIKGNLSELAPLTSLTILNVARNNNIIGNIKDIRLPLENLGVYETRITGELIEFVKTQRSAGRTTGSCGNGGWWGNNITFNGSIAGTQSPLTWTENTITLGDVTVNQ